MNLKEHLELADSIVSDWPAWKQVQLGRWEHYCIQWKDERGVTMTHSRRFLTLESTTFAIESLSMAVEHRDNVLFIRGPGRELVAAYSNGRKLADYRLTHISPNGAEPGSLAYAAEAWVLVQGLKIPTKKQPHMHQGMLDDFKESEAYDLWASTDPG